MKYETLKNASQKSLNLKLLDKGIKVGKNVWKKNGFIESRPALCSNLQNIIGKNVPKTAEIHKYDLTDTQIFIDGKYHRIATVHAIDSDSAYFVFVYLIDEDCRVTEAGNMLFLRNSESSFYIPENVTFYVGKGTNGGGIYAMVSLVNMMDFESREHRIYEISEDFQIWNVNYNYYVPTVYINGRGNDYDLAKRMDIAVESSPKELETLNMLDGRFYAYYSSDGYSSSFKLPFSQLSGESVICRVYANSKSYIEWSLIGSNQSQSLEFCGQMVFVELDREKGVITFKTAGGEFSVPQMMHYKENNIRIFAKKEIPNAFQKVVSCRHSTTLNSKIVFSGGDFGSEIYYTQFENPLYFPLITNNSAGSPMSEITAMAEFENRIIAFKNTNAYTVEIENPIPFNTTNLLLDNPAVFYSQKGIKIKTISDTVGCANKSSLAKLNGHLIWQNASGGFCVYGGSNIYEISNDLINESKEWGKGDKTYATAFDKYYIAVNGSMAFVLDFEDEKHYDWYVWQFPENLQVCGVFSYNNKPVFICNDSKKRVCYTANFADGKDTVLNYENGEVKESQQFIKPEITTASFKLCELGKAVKINNIFLNLSAKSDVDIKISSGDNFCDFKIFESDFCCADYKTVQISPNLKCKNAVQITIKSPKPFKISESALYFSELEV